MQGLNMLQSLLGLGLDTRSDGKGPPLQEDHGFFEALLESGAFRELGLDADALRGQLLAADGKQLPPMGPLLPPAVDEHEGGGDGRVPGFMVEADTGALAERRLLGVMASRDGDALSEQGKQLAARLVLLEQIQLRQQLLSQGPAAEGVGGLSASSEAPSAGGLLSYAQTAGLLEGQLRGAVPSYTVHTGMDQPGWGQALGERLVIAARQGIQQATIQLNPRELGPLEVTISVREDKTAIHFTAQHAVTREALEAELPRLRQMMQDHGYQGVDVDVSREQHRQAGAQGGAGGQAQHEHSDEPVAEAAAVERPLEPKGLVDHYA